MGISIIIGGAMFIIGVLGIVMNRRNILIMIMSIELIVLAVNISIVSSSVLINDITGQVIVVFILTVAAAESAIGLALLVSSYRVKGSISMHSISILRG